MKPSSALILEQDGIVLLHRSKSGWRAIGSADPGADDLDENMAFLRRTAMELSGGKFATKLIVPNSQILYRELNLGPMDSSNKPSAVREALEGLTPYGVDELAFDWRDLGDGRVCVAVVAEQTLHEAEAFADSHRFSPLCFAAIPDPDVFDGEPYFGETSIAHKLLNPGGKVEREDPPIRRSDVIGAPQVRDVAAAKPAAVEEEQLPEATGGASDTPAPVEFVSRRIPAPPSEAPLNLKWVTPQLSARDIDLTAPAYPEIGVNSGSILPDEPPLRAARRETPAAKQTVPPPPDANVRPPARPAAPLLDQRKAVVIGAPLVLGVLAALILAGLAAFLLFNNTRALAPDNAQVTGAAPEAVVAPPPSEPDDATTPAPEPETSLGDLPPLLPDYAPSQALPGSGDAQGTTDIAALPEPLDAPRTETPTPTLGENSGADDPAASLAPLRDLTLDPVELLAEAPASPELPSSDRIDGLYLASIDPVILGHDAVALPALAGAMPDETILAPGTPPQAGTQFDFDENGMVRATAEGSLTPEGALVIAGSPPVRPLPRPGSNAVAVPSGLSPQRIAELASFRPRPRPGGLQETEERGRLSGLSRTELAAFRPMARPASLEAAANEPQPDTTPTEQAVVASLRPVARPSGLAAAVNEALRQATTGGATTAPAALPPVPSGATVAQAATIQNGVRLNALSLIGVYGTSSNRRALVRLSSGRFVMVSVGDRLDGGRVSAISEDSLVYAKGGRNVTLDMPPG